MKRKAIKPKPKHKKTPLKKLEDELDEMFSECVRRIAVETYGGCEYCGKQRKWEELDTSHYIGRRNRHTRWDFDNCVGVDWGCHIQVFHERPDIYTAWMKKRLGSEKYEQLTIRANMTDKVDRQAVKENLIGYLEALR